MSSWQSIVDSFGHLNEQQDFIPNKTEPEPTMAWLNHMGVLKIHGPDAERFLQGQLTCNLAELEKGQTLLGACCTAKGRMIANFFIFNDGEAYWLILPADSAEGLAAHLQKYKVFFKAELENLSETIKVFAHFNDQGQIKIPDEVLSASLTLADQELSQSLLNSVNCRTDVWRLLSIKSGLHLISADQTDQWIPQQLNWHQLNGVSFNKGCYTGQEIVARMQYLGKSKKSLQHYQGAAEGHTLLTASKLYSEAGKAIAELVVERNDTEGQLQLLAVVNAEQAPEKLYLDESLQKSVTLQNLPYTVEKAE